MENQQTGDVKDEGKGCCGSGRSRMGCCGVKALAVIGLLSIGYFAGHCRRSCETKQSATVAPVEAPAAPVAPATTPKKK